MHDTALEIGRKFFDVYANDRSGLTIVDVGALDFNGSLRAVAPPGNRYIGVDSVAGNGVDIVATDPYQLPIEDGSADIVVCSSCFEHSDFFWLLFIEIQRLLKPSGIFYLNAPSNGLFHRHPVDCWRFYPDSGVALERWGRRSGYATAMLESFISMQRGNQWNDFVAVFLRDARYSDLYPERIQSKYSRYTNGLVYGSDGFTRFMETPEDQLLRLGVIAGK
jgi:SAM-dependent methyltransferase